jgi:hypothetical protein
LPPTADLFFDFITRDAADGNCTLAAREQFSAPWVFEQAIGDAEKQRA